jgi:hypothetical protein
MIRRKKMDPSVLDGSKVQEGKAAGVNSFS